jgi:uncharacterized protein YcbX
MRISAIATYPVKGCHRVEHDAADVEPWGLAGDRRWMMVDADGVGITQREEARLTQLVARDEPDGVVLAAPGMADLRVPFPHDGPPLAVRVFRSKQPVPARVAETAWSSEFLGRDATLVWQEDPRGRTAEGLSLADGNPLLLSNTASLDALNDWLAEDGESPVPMTRFRPNLVVDGAPAWAEDGWIGGRVLVGDIPFLVASACSRCVVTTVDQETGEVGRQPLRALGRHRRYDDGLLFGINLIPDIAPGETAVIRVGESSLAVS